MIHGIPVTLIQLVQTGSNDFNEPIYAETPVTVEDVLVSNPTTEDVAQALNLYGKRLAYTLMIPKGDAHDWDDVKVQFFGRTFRSFGLPVEYIPENIPAAIRWNKQVKVEVIT